MTRCFAQFLAFTILAISLAACGPARLPQSGSIDDPSEPTNRAIHSFNVGVDRAVVRPAASAYGAVVPEPVRQGVGNFASNLDQPRYVVNNLLQLRLEDAMRNTFRFLMNSTFGLGGLLDPASEMGLYEEETDFGETMHIWGVEEGAYMELPLIGPSTNRDTAGWIVDRVMNPVRLIVPADQLRYATAVSLTDRLGSRYRYFDTIDGVLYESADSYTQARLIYLQARRHELRGNTPSGEEYLDPYSDPYADAYVDPYLDPYESLDAN